MKKKDSNKPSLRDTNTYFENGIKISKVAIDEVIENTIKRNNKRSK